MSNEVHTEPIFPAIAELSEEIKGVETRLNAKINKNAEKMDQTENRLSQQINRLGSKVTVLSEGLLKTQTDVQET